MAWNMFVVGDIAMILLPNLSETCVNNEFGGFLLSIYVVAGISCFRRCLVGTC